MNIHHQGRHAARARRRRNAFVEAAEHDPERFSALWRERLEQYAARIREMGGRLEERGHALPSRYAVVEEAVELLCACGTQAVLREFDPTVRYLEAVCGIEVSRTARQPLYPRGTRPGL